MYQPGDTVLITDIGSYFDLGSPLVCNAMLMLTVVEVVIIVIEVLWGTGTSLMVP